MYLNRFTPRLIVIILFVVLTMGANAATKTASVSGNWSSTATWGGAAVPVATDVVVINDGVTVTYDVTSSPAIAGVTIGQGTSGILQFNDQSTALALNISGSLTVSAGATLQSNPSPSVNGIHAVNITNGNIVNNGTINLRNTAGAFTSAVNTTILGSTTALTYSGTGVNTFNNFTQSNTAVTPGFQLSNDMNVAGVVTISATSFFGLNGHVLTVSGSGTAVTLTAAANFVASAAGSTLALTGTAAQTVNSALMTVYNLTINPSAGVTVSQGATAITVSNNLTVSQGTFSDNGVQLIGNATGTLSVANGATLQIGIGGATVEGFPTLFTNAHISLASGSTVNYNTTGAQSISNVPTYANLTVTGASIKTIVTPGITVNGNLNIATSGETLSDGGFQIVGNATGILTVAGGATLQIGIGTNTTETFPTNFTNANIFLAATSTVNYNWITGTTQIVSSVPTYGALTITGASGTKTLNGNTLVAGNFSIATAGETFADGGFTLTVNGNVTNNATHSGAGEILLSGGSAPHVVTGTTDVYGKLELNDAQGATFANTSATTTVTTLLVTAGTLTLNAFTTSLTVTTTTVSGTLAFNSATGTRSLGNVTVNTGGAINVTTAPTAPLVVTDINVNGGTWNNSSNVAVTVNGSITQNGTFTSGSGIYTLAGAAKSIATTSSALTISNATVSGTYTVSANFASGNPFTVSTALIVSLAASNLTNNGFVSTASLTVTTAGGSFTNNLNLSITGNGGVLAGAGTFTNAATGTLNYAGTAAPTVTTFTTTAAGNTVVYNGAANQAARGTTYSNLTITPSISTVIVTLNAATTITGNLLVSAGTLADGAFAVTGNATGTFTVAASATYTASCATAGFIAPSAFTTAHISLDPASTFNYNASGTIPAVYTTYGILNSGVGGAKLLGGPISVVSLNVTAGSFGDGHFQITGNSAGSLSVSAGATLLIGDGTSTITTFPTNFLTANISLAPTSTVTYNSGTNPQTIAASIASVGPSTYGNLTIAVGTANTKTAAGPFTVAGNLTLSAGAQIFADGGNIITVKGNVTNNATHSGAGEILLSGGAASHTVTSTGTSTFGNFELNDAQGATINNTGTTTAISGNLIVTGGALIISSFVTSLTVTGTTTVASGASIIVNSATGTKTFTGDVTVTGTWNNSGNSPITMAGNLSINTGATFTSGTGLYTMTGTTKTIGGTIASATFSGALSVSVSVSNTIPTLTVTGILQGVGTLTMGANTQLNLIAATTTITGLNCTANTPNTVSYNGTAAQATKNSATTYNNVIINPSVGITVTLGAASTINSNLTITQGTFADGTLLLTGPGSGTGTFTINGTGAFTMTNTSTATTAGDIGCFPIFQTYAFNSLNTTATSSTVSFNASAAQTIPALTYGNLVLGGGGIKPAQGTITATSLAVNAGTINDVTFTINVKENVTMAGTHTGTGKISLNGGGVVHNLTGAGSYTNLELNDVNGATMGASTIVNGTLTLTTGTFTVGAFTLTLNGPAIAGTGTNLSTGTTSALSFGPVTNASNGLYIPSSVTNLSALTINIVATNTVATNSNITLNLAGTELTLTSGLLNIGANNITFGATNGTLTGGSASSYIIGTGGGQVMKVFAAATNTSFTFPVGDNNVASDYSPISLTNFNPVGSTATIGVKVTDGIHSQMNSNATQTNYITRYWTFSEAGTYTSYSYTALALTYINSTGDAVPSTAAITTANDQINRYDNGTSTWWQLTSTIAAPVATTSLTYDNVSGKLGNNDFTLRLNAATTYTWNNNAGGAWTTPGNWTPTRTTPSNFDVLVLNGSVTAGPVTITAVPTQTVAQLQVINGINASLQSTASSTLSLGNTATNTNVLTVDATSTLQLSSTAAVATTLAFTNLVGSATNIAGTIVLNSNTSNNNTLNFTNLLLANNTITGTITNNGGLVTATTGTTKFATGSTYTHNVSTAVAMPAPTWDPASLCQVAGSNVVTAAPTGFAGQAFGNFTWNCPAQTGTISMTLSTATTFAGNVLITTTNTGALVFNTAAVTTTIGGNFTLTSGTVYLTQAAVAAALTVTGTTNLNGGSFILTSTTTPPTFTATGTLTVAVGATLNFGTGASGAGTVIARGNVSNSGTINSTVASSLLNMNGTSAQTIAGTGTWTTGTSGRLLNLTVNNNSGSNPAVDLQTNLTLQTALNLTNGILGSSNGATLTLGIPSTIFTTNRVTVGSLSLTTAYGYSTAAYGINYSGGTTVATGSELPPNTTPTNGVVAVTGASTNIQLSADASINQLSMVSGASVFNVNGHTLSIGGNATPINNTAGTLTADVTSNSASKIKLIGTVAQSTITIGTYTNSNIANLEVAYSAAVAGTMVTTALNLTNLNISTATSTFSIGTTTFSIAGTYANSGTLTANGAGSILQFNGGSPQTFAPGTYTGSVITNFKVNNTAGVSLTAPVNATTLTLTAGQLNTVSGLLTVIGTATTNVTNASNSTYVNGPLARTFPASLVSGSTYTFPIGKSTYNLYEMINPTTSAAGTVVIKAEVTDAAPGGTSGVGIDISPSSQYWQASLSGTGAFTSWGNVRLTSSGLSATNLVGYSTTLTGTYNTEGGNVVGSTVATTATLPLANANNFFVVGNKGCLSGTYTVGPTGQFANLTAVASALNSSYVCGNTIFEFQTTYVGTSGETFPITFNAFNYNGTGTWTVTVRPSSGVSSNITTSGTTASAGLIVLNGVSNLILDGVPGGATVGTNAVTDSKWIINSTTTTLPTIQFTNGANANTLQYVQVQGQDITTPGTGAYTAAGTISFSNTAPTIGNKNNVINYCAISDNGTGTPVCAVYSYGNTTALANDGNSVTNCNIFNFWNAAAATEGIYVLNASSGWTITGNSFYQTATRTATAAVAHTAIWINNTSGNAYTVSNNIIGGANSSGTGTAWTVGGVFSTSFVGINLSVGSTSATNVENNKITDFSWASNSIVASPPGTFTGIYVTNGIVNIGDVTGNVIGNSTNGSTGSITISNNSASTNSNGNFYGIVNSAANGPINIQNNVIASISASCTSTSNGFSITGISFGQGNATRVVSSNTVGNSATTNSINTSSASTSTTAQSVTGIVSSSATNVFNVNNNVISNLNNSYAGTAAAGQVIGINIPSEVASSNVISGNTISNLSNAAALTGGYNAASVIGINFTPTGGATHLISQNTIHSLSSSYAGASAVNIVGIVYAGVGGLTAINTVERNFIHSFSLASSSTAASMVGLSVYANGTSNNDFKNNMIRLGIDKTGSSNATAYSIIGIKDSSSSVSSSVTFYNYYFNSVYIGGTSTSGSNNSYCYYGLNVTGVPTRNIKDNIFYNHRSGSGSNYAIRVPAFTTLTSNYNDLLTDGALGAKVGNTNGTDYTTLATWQKQGGATIVTDANSISGNPQFIQPTGDNTTYPGSSTGVSLHILGSQGTTAVVTPIEGIGTVISSSSTNNAVSNDIDNDARGPYPVSAANGGGTAPDMGADEGDFKPIDLTPPSITYTNLANTCNSNTSATLSATITDATGINTTTGTKPRVYFKKSTDANDLTGWKNSEATNSSSPFTFTLDFTQLNAGGVSAGDVIQYFVVAQDLSPAVNVAINSGTTTGTATSVALVTGNFPMSGTINSFSILPCSGTVTVGTGTNYPSLTNTGGIFQALQSTTLTGNLVVQITSDLTAATEGGTGETGTFALTPPSLTGFTITIQPNNTTSRLISGAVTTNAMIPFTGATCTNVTVDGSSGGSGTYLTFRNTGTTASTAGPVIQFDGSANNNTFKNCFVETNSTNAASGAIVFGAVTGSTSNNTIASNNIHPSTGNSMANGIYNATATNASNTITANNIYDFTTTGILLSSAGNGWTIGGSTSGAGNDFYQTATLGTAQTAISVGAGTGHTIRFNSIGGSATSLSGTWTNNAAVAVTGISLTGAAAATISNNTISNFSLSIATATAPTFTGIGINSTGATTISTNTVQAVSIPSATGAASITGISIAGTGTGTVQSNIIGSTSTANSFNNVSGTAGVKGITSSSTSTATLIGGSTSGLGNTVANLSIASATAQVIGINVTAGTNTIQNNSISTLTTSAGNTGTGVSASVIGILQAATAGAQVTSNNNISALNASANAAVNVVGVCFSSTAPHTVAGNFIHNFATSSTTSAQQGINITAAATGAASVYKNNMIALGLDAAGSAVTNSVAYTGILKSNTTTSNFYNNSVYIGGSSITGSTINTYAFKQAATGSDDIRNNIFVNARSNASGTALHYAYVLNSTTIGASDYNIYYAPGTGGSIGSVNGGTTALNLQALRFNLVVASVNQDQYSGIGDPNFITPSGTSTTTNLHLNAATPAEGAGVLIGSVIDDFDGQTRSSFTPTDIGADADNFNTLVAAADIYTPVVTVSAVSAQTACGGSLSVPITATVTDVGTGVATGALAPQLWWRLSTGTWAALAPTSSVGNTYSYILSLSGVSSGQTYQYYVAAQDQASTPNIGYSNFNATTPVHASVTTAPSTLNTNPASFTISASTPLSGTVYVGTGAGSPAYTTFSAASGLFSAINTNGLSGDLTVIVQNNITGETGANALNQWTEYCGSGGYKIKIQPDGTTLRVDSGTYTGTNAMITFNGADRVFIDGQYNGDGLRHLKFRNTSAGFSNTSGYGTIYLMNDATNDTVKNCIIEGLTKANSSGTITGGVVAVTTGTTTGNDFNTFDGNLITGSVAGGGGDAALCLFYSSGTSSSVDNNDITISNNEFKDFSVWSSNLNGLTTARCYGIHVNATGNGSNWKIKGNSFYTTFPENQGMWTALSFQPGASSNNDTIQGNYIGGSAAQCGACPSCAFNYLGATFAPSAETQYQGMLINAGTVAINYNTIKRIWIRNTNYSGFVTMYIQGSTNATIHSNFFGGTNGPSFTSPTTCDYIQVDGGGLSVGSGGVGPGYIYGIWSQASTTLTADSNIFYTLFQTGNISNFGGNVQCIVHQGTGAAVITNNNISNPNAAGRNYSSYGIRLEPTANTTGNRIENNVITGPSVIGGSTSTGVRCDAIYVNLTAGRTVSGTIKNNKIYSLNSLQTSGWLEGILVTNNNTTGIGNFDIYNNMIYLNNLGSTTSVQINGINLGLNSSSTTNVLYNSAWVAGSTSSSNGNNCFSLFRYPNGTGSVVGDNCTIRNNILINTRVTSVAGPIFAAIGNQFSAGVSQSGYSSNYNLLVNSGGTGSYNGVWQLTAYATMALYKAAANGTEANSYTPTTYSATLGASNFGTGVLNPVDLFNSTSDLHISTSTSAYQFVYQRATPITTAAGFSINVPVDFDANARDVSTPTVGADEIISVPNDAGITSIASAVPTLCPGSQTVTATIKNFGTATLNSVTVNWSVNGVAQTPVSFSSMALASGASVIKNLGTFNFTSGTSYTIVATTSVPNGVTDLNTTNDSYTFTGAASMPATVYVGTGAGSPSYATYSSLFNAINNTGLSQNLHVLVQNSTTEPSTPIFLNATNICSGTDTIFITPVSATVFTASGTTNTSAIIGFNGASNVVIDGSYGGSGQYLHFNNTNSSATAGTVIFQNSANHIVIRNCVIDLQSSAAVTGPVVSLSTSSSGSTGNSYITLSGNNIGDGVSYLSTSMIQSSGTSGTPNHDNSIINNNIFNFGDPTRAYGINVTATGNGSNWIINGNSIYNTAAVSSGAQTGINFAPGSSSSGDSISNNYLGGSAPLCSNSGYGYWESSWNSGNTLNELDVVVVNAGTVTISGNNVQRILNSNNNNSGIIVFTVLGSTNATFTSNYLGNSDAVQADEIVSNGGAKIPGSLPGYVEGIKTTSSGTVTIKNNTFYYLTQVGAHNGGYVTGIEYTGSGPISITNNYFAGLQSAANYTNYDVDINPLTAVTGIQVDSNTFAGPYVQGLGQVAGISVAGPSGTTGTVNKNTIYNLYNASTGGNSLDISIGITTTGAGAWTVSNNFITMENYSILTSSYYTNAVGEYGILDNMSGGSLTCDYNTVYIGGSQTGSANSNWYSYAFARQITSSGDALSLKNNIFMNNRTGAGNHYAIGTNPTTGWTSSTSDYNFLSSANTSTLGQWGSTDETFAGWQSAASAEAHSTNAQTTTGSSSSTLINPNELFTAEHSANLEILLTVPAAYAFINANATPITGITTDINNTTRSTVNPDMGADEFITCISPTITTQPTNQTICALGTATFTFAGGGAAPITYQWQESTNNGSTWSNITNGGIYSGATSTSLVLTGVTATMNAYQYKAIATNACGNITTSAATLTVNTAPAITVYNPVTFINTVCVGSNTSFGVTATGAGLTYVWEVSTNGGATWNTVSNGSGYSNATTSTLGIATANSMNGNLYHVIVSGTCSPPVTSSTGTLNVYAIPNVGTQPSNSSVCEGATTSFSITSSGAGLTDHWQESTNGGSTWSNITNGGIYSGATSTTLTLTGVSAAMSGYKYQCVVSGLCTPSATSTAVTLTVTALPTITSTTPGANCGTGTVVLGATSSAGTINWYAAATGGSSLATGTSFTTPSISSTTTYYADATSNGCTTSTRTSVTATINASPTITSTTPGSNCGVGTVTLGATASTGTINWYAAATGGSSLATGTSFTTPSISTTTIYYVDATASGCTTPTRTSVTATITSGFTLTAVLDNCACYQASTFQNVIVVYASGGLGSYTFTPITSGDAIQTTIDGGGLSYSGNGHTGVKGVFFAAADGASHQFQVSDGACTVNVSKVTHSGPPIDIAFAGATQSPAGLPGQGGGNGISGSFNNSGANSPGIISSQVNGPALYCHQTADFGNKWVTYIANNADASGTPLPNDSVDNKALVEINNYGQNLDSVAVSVYREPVLPSVANTGVACGTFPQYAMERHYVIQSTKSTGANSFTDPVGVRLYFSDAEMQDVVYWSNKVATDNAGGPNGPCAAMQVVNNTSQLYVTKYTGLHEDGDYSNNTAAGLYRIFGANTTTSLGNGPSYFDGTNGNGVFGNSLGTNRHFVEVNVREFSELWLSGSGDIEPLPVEMTYLEANAIDNQYIRVSWATAMEINNKEFQVERSIDGHTWSQIGIVDGHGNSTTTIEYNFDDRNVVSNVRYYYRLKQVDLNLNFKYTGIVSAILTGVNSFDISIAPNPAYSLTHLNINSSVAQEIEVNVFDVIGQKVLSGNHQLAAGLNSIDLALGNLASGTYSVSVVSGNQVYTKKLVITK